MTDRDIVTELRHRHANVTGIDPRITTPIVGQTIFSQAAEEIDRLRRRLLAEENAYDILRLECEKLTADLATCRRILPAHIERVMYEGEG